MLVYGRGHDLNGGGIRFPRHLVARPAVAPGLGSGAASGAELRSSRQPDRVMAGGFPPFRPKRSADGKRAGVAAALRPGTESPLLAYQPVSDGFAGIFVPSANMRRVSGRCVPEFGPFGCGAATMTDNIWSLTSWSIKQAVAMTQLGGAEVGPSFALRTTSVQGS